MRSRESSGCSLEPPAPEAVQSGRGGGAETSVPDKSEEDPDGPLQHAAGQRAAGSVSGHSNLFIHIKTFIITLRIIIVTFLYNTFYSRRYRVLDIQSKQTVYQSMSQKEKILEL